MMPAGRTPAEAVSSSFAAIALSDTHQADVQPAKDSWESPGVVRTKPPSYASPTSLLTLPDELLIDIISHVDRSAALALRYASSRFLPLTEAHRWRMLNLTVRDIPPACKATSVEGLRKVEKEFRQRLAGKVAVVIDQMNNRRAAMVDLVVLAPRPGAISGIVKILKDVSTTLLSLSIDAPSIYTMVAVPKTLDFQLHAAHIAFPVLRSLSVVRKATRLAGCLPYLWGLAPKLETFTVDLNGVSSLPFEADEASSPHYPPSSPHRGVKTLSITLVACANSPQEDLRLFTPYIDFFPNITRLILDYPILVGCRLDGLFGNGGEGRRSSMFQIILQLEQLKHLQDLVWGVELERLHMFSARHNPGFPSLRRLVVGSCRPDITEERLPFYPHLEAIYISALPNRAYPASPPNPSSKPRADNRTLSAFASDLHALPKLRTFHYLEDDISALGLGIFDKLDQIDAAGTENGVITSVRRGNDELLDVRFLGVRPNGSTGWTHLTEFRGKVVPMEVVEEVRVKAGIKEEDWRGRGVDVGKAAWRTLERWCEIDEIAIDMAYMMLKEKKRVKMSVKSTGARKYRHF